MSELKSENPYKYGDIFIGRENGIGTEAMVLAIIGDLVALSSIDSDTTLSRWIHWEELEGYGWKLKIPKKWENLTMENWKDRRDQAVWVRDIKNKKAFIRRLSYVMINPVESGIAYHTMSDNKYSWCWDECSIYNDDGVEASFTEVKNE